MKIALNSIDEGNYMECINLKLKVEQKEYVASNEFSLAQAAYELHYYPLGIYYGRQMVGFILYDYDEDIKGWSMSRFMIDRNYQNRQFGTMALKQFIEFFRMKYETNKLFTSVSISNKKAIKLYENFGFEKLDVFEYEIDEKIHKEIRMVLKFNNAK